MNKKIVDASIVRGLYKAWCTHNRLIFFMVATNVHLKLLVLQGTVEERMEAVQARKQRMISGALTDQEVRTARIEELKMLFT